MQECTTRLPLTFIDEKFLGTDALGIVALSPGRLDIGRQAASFTAALAAAPIFASRIVGEGPSELWLEFDPQAARLEVRAPLAVRREEISVDHVDVFAGALPSSIGSATAMLTATPLLDGFAICFTTSHVAGDAFSLLALVRSWIYAQVGAPPLKRSQQRRHHLSVDDLAAIDPRPFETGQQAAPPKRHRESMTLPAAELQLLMKQSGGTLQQAAFVLLLRAHRERLFRYGSSIRLRIPVDVRGLMPGLDDEYLGNAFVDALAEVGEPELDGDPRVLAGRIGQAIARAKQPEFLARVLTLGPHGLEPTASWADEQGTLDFKRDVILSSILGRVAPNGVNLGQGPGTFLAKAELPRGFLLVPGQGNDVAVEVRLGPSLRGAKAE